MRNFLHLGDSAWAIPVALGMLLILLLQGQWRAATVWLLSFTGAMLVIVAGKIAFDLFGLSVPAWQFYNISGHAMFASAVYPTLGGLLTAGAGPHWHRLGILLGSALALTLGWALVDGLHHTLSETVLGSAVGFAAAFLTLRQRPRLHVALRAGLLAMPLVAFVLWQHVYHPVHQTRHGVWAQVAQWFDIDQRYTRRITRHPDTGRTQVTVGRARLRVGQVELPVGQG